MDEVMVPVAPTHSTASIARLATLATAGIALLVLIGWLFQITLFKSVMAHWQAMSIITAGCFLLTAFELAWLRRDPAAVRRGLLLQAPALLIGLVGLVTIGLYAVSLGSGQPPPVGRIPLLELFWLPATRLALLTAILFVGTGCALGLLARGGRRAVNAAHLLMVAVGLAGYLVVLGYLLGVEPLHRLLDVSVSVYTGLAFCMVSVAMLHLQPDSWLMGVFASNKAGGVVGRRLLPAILLIPLAIGWLRLYGERSGLFGSKAGEVLVALTYATLLLGLLWLTARSVNRADEQRRLAEQQFTTIFALTPDLAAVAGFDGRFRQLSPSWEAVLGWPRTELLARPCLHFVHPDDRDATAEAARLLAAGNPLRQFVNRYRHQDGSYRWIEWYAVPIAELGLTYNAARDITERIQAQEERERLLTEMEHRAAELDSVFGALPFLVSLHGPDGRWLRTNPAVGKLFGFDPTSSTREEVARRLQARFPDGTPLTHGNMPSSRALQGEAVFGQEYLITDARGEDHILLFNATPLKVGNKVYGMVLAQMDITERKQAEELLQRTHDELEQRVAERTADLIKLNSALEAEIIERQRAEGEIRRFNNELELRVQERTTELEKKNEELQRMNRLFVGRELKMVELKRQIKELQEHADTVHQD